MNEYYRFLLPRTFVDAVVVLSLAYLILSRVIQSLGDFVVVVMFLAYWFVGILVLAGAAMIGVVLARRLTPPVVVIPTYDVRFICKYPPTCATRNTYTALRTERVHDARVTRPGEAEVYVRARWNVIKVIAIDPVTQ